MQVPARKTVLLICIVVGAINLLVAVNAEEPIMPWNIHTPESSNATDPSSQNPDSSTKPATPNPGAATPSASSAPAASPAPATPVAEIKTPEEAIQKARMEVERKRFTDAKLALKQCLNSNPKNIQLYMELHSVAVKANDWSDASQSLEKVMELDPSKEKELYSDYGQTLYKLKRYDKAKTVFAKALVYGKDKDAIHKTLIQIALHEKDDPSAIAEYKEYLKLKPNDGDMHWEYANFLYKGKKLKESIPEYKLAAQHRPNDSYGHAFLGQLLLVEKDYDGAVSEFKKAIQTKGGDAGSLRESLRYALKQQKLAAGPPKD